jgi:hypothetical protein
MKGVALLKLVSLRRGAAAIAWGFSGTQEVDASFRDRGRKRVGPTRLRPSRASPDHGVTFTGPSITKRSTLYLYACMNSSQAASEFEADHSCFECFVGISAPGDLLQANALTPRTIT